MEENELKTTDGTAEYDETPENRAGCFALGFSFLFPIIGVIIYFVQRKTVDNPNAYLIAAACGFGLGIILRMASGTF